MPLFYLQPNQSKPVSQTSPTGSVADITILTLSQTSPTGSVADITILTLSQTSPTGSVADITILNPLSLLGTLSRTLDLWR